MKPGSMTGLVNAVTRDVGEDVAEWRVDRLMGMAAQIQAAGEQRQG